MARGARATATFRGSRCYVPHRQQFASPTAGVMCRPHTCWSAASHAHRGDMAPAADVEHSANAPAGVGIGSTVRWVRWLCFLTVAVLTTIYSLLVELSKRRGDVHGVSSGFAYSPLSVTFCAELLKLCISSVLVYGPQAPGPLPVWALHDVARAFLPAALYCVHNNLCFVAMRYLTPPLYQLLSQLKIVITAGLARVVLHQHLSHNQRVGVLLLTTGSSLPGVAACVADGSYPGVSPARWLAGAAVMVLVALTSGAAAVYTERALKRDPTVTVHFNNLQLYACGCMLYALPVYREWAAGGASLLAHLTTHWTGLTYVIVLVLTAQGYCISLLVKAADNFAKLFAGGVATFVSILLSIPVLGVPPRAGDVAGACVVVAALLAFHRGPSQQVGHKRLCAEQCHTRVGDGPGAVTETAEAAAAPCHPDALGQGPSTRREAKSPWTACGFWF